MVYQFLAAPDDSTNRALAGDIGRLLVQALGTDSAFQVLGATRDRYGAGRDAQYAVIGVVRQVGGIARIDARLLDIPNVAMVAKETIPLAGTPFVLAVSAGVQHLAERIHVHLTKRAP